MVVFFVAVTGRRDIPDYSFLFEENIDDDYIDPDYQPNEDELDENNTDEEDDHELQPKKKRTKNDNMDDPKECISS